MFIIIKSECHVYLILQKEKEKEKRMSCLSRDTQSYLVNSRIKIYDINIA